MTLLTLNADLGEGEKNDEELMQYIDIANIACGGHVGDEQTFTQTAKLAKINNVFVCAHPAYPDKQYFGRKPYFNLNQELDTQKLLVTAFDISLQEQIDMALLKCNEYKIPLYSIKPHGQLYHDIATSSEICEKFLTLYKQKYSDIPLIGLPTKLLIDYCDRYSIKLFREGFCDRRYTCAGLLASREQSGAVITDVSKAVEQAINIASYKRVDTIENKTIKLEVDTLCVHGDTPNSLAITKHIASTLKQQ